jgi:AcrR family transcriptional regulator
MRSQPPGADHGARPERMTRAQRRDQLLDVAADMVAVGGFAAVTMEGVAARSEVSKALPYTHFDNADDLIAALRDRELALLGQQLMDAVHSAEGFETRITAVVHVCFEAVQQRTVISSFLRWLPQFEARVRDRPPTPAPYDWFIAELFEQELGLSQPAARVAQRVFGLGLLGAYDTWTEGYATRAEAERTVVRMIVAGTQALASTEPAKARAKAAAP